MIKGNICISKNTDNRYNGIIGKIPLDYKVEANYGQG